MNKIYLCFFATISLIACNKQTHNSSFNTDFSYAEISAKEGGKWEGRKYSGGQFKNVEELQLNPLHTDHSFDIRYEGPGWENQNIGYRLYLDWRNAVDIYGKKTKDKILPQVGQDGFDSYHLPSDWGQDILKAGKSLGIGGYGRFIKDSVAHFHHVENTSVKIKNKKNEANIILNYKNWKTGNHTTDLVSKISIYPKDRFSKFELKTSIPTEGITTGIVKFNHIPLQQKSKQKWSYIATYGNQTLVNNSDLLGMAIFYKTAEVEQIKTASHDHLIVFKPTTKSITYYILSAWEQELNGIKTEKDFYNDLDQKLIELQQNDKL